jgi:C4-dicarboxylate-binding protein DctP
MAAPPSSLLTSVVPDSAVFELPSLWGISYDQYRKLVEGPFGAKLAQEYETKLGVKVIGYYNVGSWVWGTTAKSHPIARPADFQNLKIRVVGNPVVERTLKAFGAQPTQLAWPEVPTALLQGVIDGLETTLSGLDSVKGWELTKNLTFSNHKYLPYVVIMNKRSWDKIPPDLQKVLLETMDESRKWQDSELEKINTTALEHFKANGAHVEMIDAKELKAFTQAAAPAEKAFLDSSGLGTSAALAQKSVGR